VTVTTPGFTVTRGRDQCLQHEREVRISPGPQCTLHPRSDGNPEACRDESLSRGGISALALPLGGLRFAHIRPVALATVAILGIFSTGVTFYLNYRLIAEEGATTAATVGYLLPVVSVLLGAITVHEDVTVMIILGMCLTLIGVAMTRHRGPASPAVPPRGPQSTPPRHRNRCVSPDGS
jgi:EamA-like transporter family